MGGGDICDNGKEAQLSESDKEAALETSPVTGVPNTGATSLKSELELSIDWQSKEAVSGPKSSISLGSWIGIAVTRGPNCTTKYKKGLD